MLYAPRPNSWSKRSFVRLLRHTIGTGVKPLVHCVSATRAFCAKCAKRACPRRAGRKRTSRSQCARARSELGCKRICTMKMSQQNGFIWKIVVVVLGYSVVLPPGWAQGKRTTSVPSELALNVSSKDPGIPVRAMEPNFALIEKVQAIDLGQHVQVRVVGNGALSCRPFLLAAPDRLVLDCPGAHVRAGSTPTRVNLDPVLSVRVGQFKTNVARVVVELAGQTPYTVGADGNKVLVTFNSNNRQPSSLESKGKEPDSPASPVKVQSDQMASAPVPTVPDKLPDVKSTELTSAGFARAEPLPQYPSSSTPVPLQPAPEVASEPA